MSRFDEEPDGDVHGECAHEIHRLQSRIEQLERELAEAQQDAKRWNAVIKADDAIDALYSIVLGNWGDNFNINAEFDRYLSELSIQESGLSIREGKA